MSVKRQRERSARKLGKGSNPLAALHTDLHANDGLKAREIAAHREVRVTRRVSIKRQFNAARNDMGEYAPVSVLAAELDKGHKGWTDLDNKPEEVIVVDKTLRHHTVPVVEYR